MPLVVVGEERGRKLIITKIGAIVGVKTSETVSIKQKVSEHKSYFAR